MSVHTHSGPTTSVDAGVTQAIRAAVTDFFRPIDAPKGSRRRALLLARQVVVGVGAVATAAQIVVWMLAALIGGHVDEPWWLWSAVLPVVAVFGGLTAAIRVQPDHADTRTATHTPTSTTTAAE